jgi:alanyl-tRNA synthetase
MTIKLYDNDSYATEFDATVISCEKTEKGYKTLLDRTAFFPEEGGQCADRGEIDGVEITHVELAGEEIYHYSETAFDVGACVHGKIDFALRFRNMQNHTGEHIICGIAHKLFGYNNVGFHLGADYVTMDLDGELTAEDVQRIEKLANEAVYANMPVSCRYPSAEELAEMDYRAKLDITENVRIVTVGDVDMCACCAPHVAKTGEIGIIKILDAIRYKGGMRLNILCGSLAVEDYHQRYVRNVEISGLLSAKQQDIVSAVEKLLEDNNSLRQQIGEKNKQIASVIAEGVQPSDGNVCLYNGILTPDMLRLVANDAMDKVQGILVVLCGNDSDGYKYVMATSQGDISSWVKDANTALNGRGGGKGNMAQGSFASTLEEIEKYFLK